MKLFIYFFDISNHRYMASSLIGAAKITYFNWKMRNSIYFFSKEENSTYSKKCKKYFKYIRKK